MTRRMSLPGEGRSPFALPLFLLVLGAALTALLGVACGAGTKVEPAPDPQPGGTPQPGVVSTPPPGSTRVTVTLKEWAIETDQARIPAGETYFLATNVGGAAHEMVVIKTNLAPDQLPNDNGKVPEGDIDMLGEISPFSPGSSGSTVLKLKPGKYVLICNVVQHSGDIVVSHYLKGMRTALTVE